MHRLVAKWEKIILLLFVFTFFRESGTMTKLILYCAFLNLWMLAFVLVLNSHTLFSHWMKCHYNIFIITAFFFLSYVLHFHIWLKNHKQSKCYYQMNDLRNRNLTNRSIQQNRYLFCCSDTCSNTPTSASENEKSCVFFCKKWRSMLK